MIFLFVKGWCESAGFFARKKHEEQRPDQPNIKILAYERLSLALYRKTEEKNDTASGARVYQTRAGFQTPTHASNYLKTDGQLKLAAVSPPVDESMLTVRAGMILCRMRSLSKKHSQRFQVCPKYRHTTKRNKKK